MSWAAVRRKTTLAAAWVVGAAVLLAAVDQAGAAFVPRGGAGVARGTHGLPHAGGGRIARPLTPELLRPHHPLDDAVLSPTAKETLRQSTGAPHEAQPWSDAPHIHVKLSGERHADARLLHRLERELSVQIEPEHLRVASLTDDAATDLWLGSALPRNAREPVEGFVKFLRGTSDVIDAPRVASAVAAHRGETLILLMHVDGTRQAAAFRGSNGRERFVSLKTLEEGAHRAGVNLLLVGCRSGRYANAGFANKLNSLEAARAVAQAWQSAPRTLRDLFVKLSSDHMTMLIDAEKFTAEHTVSLTAGGDNQVVSSIHWYGPVVPEGEAAQTPLPAEQSGFPVAGFGAAAAFVLLLAGVSWIGGAYRALRRRQETVLDLPPLSNFAVGGYLHVSVIAVLLSVFAEVVVGEDARLWMVGTLTVLIVGAGIAIRFALRNRDKAAWMSLYLVRVCVVLVPFAAVLALMLDTSFLPAAAVAGLSALYALARPLPDPLIVAGVACIPWVLYACVTDRLDQWRERRAEADLHRQELDRSGISRPEGRRAALRARAAFDKEYRILASAGVQLNSPVKVATVPAPDAWIDGMPRQFAVFSMHVSAPKNLAGVVFFIARAGTPFMHPLPLVLARRWNEGAIGAGDLPIQLARVEPHLRRGDFLGWREMIARRLLLLALGAAALIACAALVLLLFQPGLWQSPTFWHGFGLGGLVLCVLPLAYRWKMVAHARNIVRWAGASAVAKESNHTVYQ